MKNWFCCLSLVLLLIPGATGKPVRYVTIGKNCPRYFEFDNRGWIPVSVNYLPADGNGDPDDEPEFAEIETYFRAFSTNGINAIRVWISGGFFEIEHESEGRYDPARFKRIDRFLKLAAKYGVKVKFTLQHIRFISPEASRENGWATSRALATKFNDIHEYVTTRQGRQSYFNRAKALADRYADNPNIYGWELWNEMDAAAWENGAWMDFTEEMLPRIQALFPNHLVTQTLGSLDSEDAERRYRQLFSIATNRFIAIHRYLDPADRTYDEVKGKTDHLVWSAIDFVRGHVPDRPVLINEIGAVEPNHSGPSRLYVRDREGVLLHDMVFAPFFCGAAGSGTLWHWDHYIRRNNLWEHFRRFVRATEGVDPQAEEFIPATFRTGNLRFYVLKGRSQTLIWCRDQETSWQEELEAGRQPEIIRGIEIPVEYVHSGAGCPKVEFYDPWSDRRCAGKVKDKKILLPEIRRSLVIRLYN